MTNEVVNVPELRFPEFDGDWEEKKLKDISNKGMYGIGASATEFDGENVYVRITDINESSRKINNDKLTSPDKLDKKYLLNENDVLFARTGASTGKTYIHKHYDRDKNYYFAGFLIKFEFKNNYLANFIFQNTLTKRFENWVSVMSVRSGQPGINSEEYGKLKMMFPSKVEQNKIGAFFSKLDQQIELEEKKLAKLEEQKKGYMQKLFSQELRFKDENGDDYPEWMETSIRNIFDNKGGTALEKEFDNNGTHKVISIGSYSMNSTYNEQNLRINKNDFTEKYLLNEGDLAMVLNDKTKEGNIIGRSIYIDEDDKYIYNQRTERLIPVTGNNHKFLWYLMNSEQFRKKIKQMMQGATQVYINYNSIKDLSIYLPILEEQNKIENFLGDIFNIIKNQSDKVELLKRRKKGFLQKMFV